LQYIYSGIHMIKSLLFILLFNATIIPLSSADNKQPSPFAAQQENPLPTPHFVPEQSHEKQAAQDQQEWQSLTKMQKTLHYIDTYGPLVVMTLASLTFLYFYHKTVEKIKTLKSKKYSLKKSLTNLTNDKAKLMKQMQTNQTNWLQEKNTFIEKNLKLKKQVKLHKEELKNLTKNFNSEIEYKKNLIPKKPE
jgi:hypothetical protein